MRDDDLTPYEKKALESLPMESMPAAGLEDKVVDALHREGLLGTGRRRVIELTAWRVATALAACVALVIGGYAVGVRTSSPAPVESGPVLTGASASLATSVQRAGTEYVSVLADLAEMSMTEANDDALQGREVAIKTLYTAADQIGRIIRNDALPQCIVRSITDSGTSSASATNTQIIRF